MSDYTDRRVIDDLEEMAGDLPMARVDGLDEALGDLQDQITAAAGIPGGSPGQVQYNNMGAFGGFGDWNGSQLTVAGTLSVPGSGANSERFGVGTVAGARSTAIGYNAIASHDDAIALGASAETYLPNQVMIGSVASPVHEQVMITNILGHNYHVRGLTSTSILREMSRISTVWGVSDDATRLADLVLATDGYGGPHESIRCHDTGTGTAVNVNGNLTSSANVVAQQSLYVGNVTDGAMIGSLGTRGNSLLLEFSYDGAVYFDSFGGFNFRNKSGVLLHLIAADGASSFPVNLSIGGSSNTSTTNMIPGPGDFRNYFNIVTSLGSHRSAGFTYAGWEDPVDAQRRSHYIIYTEGYNGTHEAIRCIDTVSSSTVNIPGRLRNPGMVAAADDSAAATAGVAIGEFYHASGVVRIRLV